MAHHVAAASLKTSVHSWTSYHVPLPVLTPVTPGLLVHDQLLCLALYHILSIHHDVPLPVHLQHIQDHPPGDPRDSQLQSGLSAPRTRVTSSPSCPPDLLEDGAQTPCVHFVGHPELGGGDLVPADDPWHKLPLELAGLVALAEALWGSAATSEFAGQLACPQISC